MSEPQESLVQDIFADVVALPVDAQAQYLDRACGSDHALRAKVEALLKAHRDAGAFLESAAVALPPEELAALAGDSVGTRIGRYTLTEKIGEGGFGTVYRAEQHEPVRRDVALKIIKLGMDTREVLSRFNAERQALAILDHPNIAKVFDAGITDTGRSFFVMELVRGLPITAYCDQQNLSPRQRLELFVPVCQALQHAHQKGIIHRDIKPNNVLIAEQDGSPSPRIIDFGIAKATDARLTERTQFTEFRQMIGTPAYMSPEQARPAETDIDTRSDIYSLGVLLYELLTGTTPIEERSLRRAGYDQMQKMIREFEPPPPSTRISTMGDAADSVAAVRSIERRELSRTVSGEIDWIVMKCLEKDRNRRYESAGALGDDIGRHLSGDIVAAGPPGRSYRLRKLARRHRVAIATGSLMLLCLLIALAVSLVALARERRARVLAQEATETATAVTNYAISRTLGDPRAESLFRQAHSRMRLAYGLDHPMSINAQRNLGILLIQNGNMDEAEQVLRDAADRSRRVNGLSSEVTIWTLSEIANCLTLQEKFEESLEINRELHAAVTAPGANPRLRIYFDHWLAGSLTALHRYEEARQPLLDALAYLKANGGGPLYVRGVMQALAETYEALGQPEEAARWRREVQKYQGSATTRPAAR